MPAQLKSVTKAVGKIEKGIPIPPVKHGGGASAKWPWDHMEIGDSFLMPARKMSTVSSQITTVSRRLGRKFAARAVDGGARVWRVA